MPRWTDGTWTTEPLVTQEIGEGLVVEATEGSDFWRHTLYGFVHDNGHALLAPLPELNAVEVSFDMSSLSELYDQAGLLLRAGDNRWVKAGIEISDGTPHLGAVVTTGRSDWSMAPIPAWSGIVTIRMSFVGDALVVRARPVSEGWRTLRVAPFPAGGRLQAGPMLCAPTRSGLEVVFHSWDHCPPDLDLHNSPAIL